jgi:hypothetical protein
MDKSAFTAGWQQIYYQDVVHGTLGGGNLRRVFKRICDAVVLLWFSRATYATRSIHTVSRSILPLAEIMNTMLNL